MHTTELIVDSFNGEDILVKVHHAGDWSGPLKLTDDSGGSFELTLPQAVDLVKIAIQHRTEENLEAGPDAPRRYDRASFGIQLIQALSRWI